MQETGVLSALLGRLRCVELERKGTCWITA
jgi:hypothetical protein